MIDLFLVRRDSVGMTRWQNTSSGLRLASRPPVSESVSTYTGSTSRYVRVAKFVELTGYTDKAVRCKIAEGVWIEGKQWRRAPDGAILVDMVGYERWVEGDRATA